MNKRSTSTARQTCGISTQCACQVGAHQPDRRVASRHNARAKWVHTSKTGVWHLGTMRVPSGCTPARQACGISAQCACQVGSHQQDRRVASRHNARAKWVHTSQTGVWHLGTMRVPSGFTPARQACGISAQCACQVGAHQPDRRVASRHNARAKWVHTSQTGVWHLGTMRVPSGCTPGAVIFPERARGHPGPTGFQSHHTTFPYITLYMGFYCRNINRRAHGCAILGFT